MAPAVDAPRAGRLVRTRGGRLMPRGGRRDGSGRKPSEKDPNDPYEVLWRNLGLQRGVWAYLSLWPGDTPSQQLSNALTDLSAYKPGGPKGSKPRDSKGHYLPGGKLPPMEQLVPIEGAPRPKATTRKRKIT